MASRYVGELLYALGENPTEVMAQLGHTTPGLALRLYARTMRLDGEERGQLKALVEGTDWQMRADATKTGPIAGLTRDPQNDGTRSRSGL